MVFGCRNLSMHRINVQIYATTCMLAEQLRSFRLKYYTKSHPSSMSIILLYGHSTHNFAAIDYSLNTVNVVRGLRNQK